MPAHPLEPLVDLDGVADAVTQAREACETLRWHRALRRQWAVVRAETGVRAVHAGALLDGVRVPLDLVRDVARGAAPAPLGAEGQVLLAALRVQAEVERLMAPPGTTAGPRAVPFGQLLAHLHVAATARPLDAPDLTVAGRPRSTEQPLDVRGLGAAPVGPELSARLAALGDLVATPLTPRVPALIVAAVVHGELLALRPFRDGNGAVARAMFRHLLTSGGVDPVGVTVPEVRWAGEPAVYLSSAAGFASGTTHGVAGWLRYCAGSVTEGAAQGHEVAEAVLAGRLGGPAPDPSAPASDDPAGV